MLSGKKDSNNIVRHQECADPGDIEEVLGEGGVEGLLGGQSPRPHLLVDQQSHLCAMGMVGMLILRKAPT